MYSNYMSFFVSFFLKKDILVYNFLEKSYKKTGVLSIFLSKKDIRGVWGQSPQYTFSLKEKLQKK